MAGEQFPLSMLPNTPFKERGWRASERDRKCKIQKMHFRTKLLTEYVERTLPDHGFSLGRRIRAGSPRQKLYESVYRNRAFSFLIVPAANQWVHVSPLLEATVDNAIVVTFDRQLDDLSGAHDRPTHVHVYSIPGNRMTAMANSILATGGNRRSEHVAIPLFDSVVQTQPGNHQCSLGSLETVAEQLWIEPISWVQNLAEITGAKHEGEIAEFVAALRRSGRRLRIETADSSFVVDPLQARFALS